MSQGQQLINSYRLETAIKLRQVEELADPVHPRVFHVTPASIACAITATINVADHETECPNRAREHAVIREIRRSNERERTAYQYHIFSSDVEASRLSQGRSVEHDQAVLF